jgi:hypothetical protein
MSIIDEELAKAFLDDPKSVDLSKATEITDGAAEILAGYEDRFGNPGQLYLKGLTELSEAAAESLSKHHGQLNLNGLTKLSDAAAESLSKHKTRPKAPLDRRLWLNGLTGLSDATAESLSKHEGDLILEGLTELSEAAAESLSKHHGQLNLNGLTKLSDAAVESLSKHEGDLILNGLTKLSDAAVESLSKHEGSLILQGLTELSDAAAESLSKHHGQLNLNGLTKLSDAAAESLSKVQGNLLLSDVAKESLSKQLINYGFEIIDEASITMLIGVANITDADREFEMRSGDDHETRDRFTGDFTRFLDPFKDYYEQTPSKYDINQAVKTGEEISFDFLLIEGVAGGGAYFEWGMGSELLTDTEKDQIFGECLSARLEILESYGYESNS